LVGCLELLAISPYGMLGCPVSRRALRSVSGGQFGGRRSRIHFRILERLRACCRFGLHAFNHSRPEHLKELSNVELRNFFGRRSD
jgi:hypothetical protein